MLRYIYRQDATTPVAVAKVKDDGLTDWPQLFERSKFSNEVGAAVSLMPNSVRALRALGFDLNQGQPVPVHDVSAFPPPNHRHGLRNDS